MQQHCVFIHTNHKQIIGALKVALSVRHHAHENAGLCLGPIVTHLLRNGQAFI